jgi:hypothetical protein
MSKKGRVYFLFFAIIILAGCSLATIDKAVSRKRQGATNGVQVDCDREHRGSRRYCRQGVTVVVLRGSPYELGYARGVLLREEIQDLARICEFDSNSVHRVEIQDGNLVLSNHGRKINLCEPSRSSLERFDVASRFIADHEGSMDVGRLIELNRNQILSSYGQGLSFTNLHSVVFVPGTLDFWVALGPPPATRGRWIGFSLSKELSGEGSCPDPAFFEAMH